MRLIEDVDVYYGDKALQVYCLGVYQEHAWYLQVVACGEVRMIGYHQ